MKTQKLSAVLLFVFTAFFTATNAQTKTITIIQNNDSLSVITDTLNSVTESVITIVINGEDVVLDVITGDSAINDMVDANMNMVVRVDTLDDGKIVKKVMITSSDDHPNVVHKSKRLMMISKGNNNEELVWHTTPASAPKEVLGPVAISDLHILKKAGFSANALTSEPLEFKKQSVNVKRMKTSDSDVLEIDMKITLPEKEKVTVTLIDKNGVKTDEKIYKDTDTINVKYKMDKDSVPYYIIVLQDKKLWSRKVGF